MDSTTASPGGFTQGPWQRTLRSSGQLTSSMVSQSPKYSSFYKTTGKPLGCRNPSRTFDYTGRYSLNAIGTMYPIKPVVSEHDELYEGCKFARQLYTTLEARRIKAKNAGPKSAPPKKERVWTPPDTVPEGTVRRDQTSSLKLR